MSLNFENHYPGGPVSCRGPFTGCWAHIKFRGGDIRSPRQELGVGTEAELGKVPAAPCTYCDAQPLQALASSSVK